MSPTKKQIALYFFLTCSLITFLPALNYYHNSKITTLKAYFSIDILESCRNLFFYNYFQRSMNNNTVIVGKKGFVYLGDENNYLLSKTQNLAPFDFRPLDKWTNNLNELQQWYEKQDIKFIVVVVPNKHTIYPEYLPNWVKVNKPNLTDRLIDSAQQAGINLLDLKPIFLSQKVRNNELLYYKTDSHWNNTAASLGLFSIIDYLNTKYTLNIIIPEYTFHNEKTKGLGNARLLKMNLLLPDATEIKQYISFANKTKVCHADIDKITLDLKNCLLDKNKPYNIHKGAHYFINSNALNKQKILFLGDSFSNPQTKLLNQIFNTRWQFHYNKISQNGIEKFIKKNKPDIVIYQIVERSLYNNKFIKAI